MSESTAIRTRPNLAARLRPRPTTPHGRVSRIRIGRTAAGGREHEAMTVETGDAHGPDLEGAATERRCGRFGRGELRDDVATFPGDQRATRLKQRERELDELRQRPDRAGRHGRPAATVPRVAGQGLRPDGGRLDSGLE